MEVSTRPGDLLWREGRGEWEREAPPAQKDLVYTIPHPKEFGLDRGDAGEPGMGLRRQTCSSLLGVDWGKSLVGSWRSSQERLPETARLRVDREGWGSKTEKMYESSGLSRAAALGSGHRRRIGGKGKRRGQFSFPC